MIAIELCAGGDPHRPDAELTKALTARARELGLIVLSCGLYGNVIRILVPITAEDAVIDEGLDACLADNCDAWELAADGTWSHVKPRRGARRRSAQRLLLERLREKARDD